jgi:hypothetical protein
LPHPAKQIFNSANGGRPGLPDDFIFKPKIPIRQVFRGCQMVLFSKQKSQFVNCSGVASWFYFQNKNPNSSTVPGLPDGFVFKPKIPIRQLFRGCQMVLLSSQKSQFVNCSGVAR